MKPSHVKGWGLIYFGRPVNEEHLRHFAKTVNLSFLAYGMQVQRQDPPTAIANPQGDMARTIVEMLHKVEGIGGVRPNLIMFLLPTNAVEPYATIKAICDTQFGIASQCMLAEKALSEKGQQQYLGNIALKVNIKLGGVNSRIEDPFLRRRRTLIIGCDAAHPNPSQRRLNPPPPTFTALAANYDAACAQYSAVTASQDPGTEMVEQFGPMAEELFRRYVKRVGHSPESVLYFRDGVSESEFSTVLAVELKALKSMFLISPLTNQLTPHRAEVTGKAKVTVIVCVKRHHTRLFPLIANHGDRLGNVPPGTVVENGNGRDIFLVSHAGLQGTVRPTHYVVLYDENKISVEEFQGLCNNLCYGYGRATVAVSLVPPVYYAHLACERARQHVRHEATGSVLLQVQGNLKYSMVSAMAGAWWRCVWVCANLCGCA